MAWLGVDLGTQSVRAVLVGGPDAAAAGIGAGAGARSRTGDGAGAGAVLGRGAAPLRSRRWDDGRHEQDPESWWTAVADATRQALAQSGAVEIDGVACCGTSGTVLLVEETADDPARPLTPGLMYDDARAVAEAALVEREPAPVWSELGLTPQRTWALPKALWLVRHALGAATAPGPSPRWAPGPAPGTGSGGAAAGASPDGGPGRVRLAHQVDVITSRLIGQPAPADTSHALKTGVDPLTAAWPYDDLVRLGLDPGVLPRVVRPGTVLGGVCRAAAERTGIPEGVPVVAGMTDGCAAQIAAGVLGPGQWGFVLGTTTVLKGVSAQLLHDPTGALYSHRSPDGFWWPGGASSAGAGVLNQEFDPDDFPGLEGLAAAREPAGCLTYPLVSPGERFPFRRPDARRLTLGTPRDDADRFAAILQGVGYVQRLCLDHLRALGASVGNPITVTGGATRSAYWTQLQADILRRDVAVPRYAEGAVGMAVLAASTVHGLPAAAERMTGPATVFHPRDGTHFDEPYARLVTELERRGWIDRRLAQSALAGAAT